MTTATLEKRVRALEEEIKELRQAVAPKKKLPTGVLAGLYDVRAGRVHGPFYSGEEMRRAFEKK